MEMQTITIAVPGDEYETINVELTGEEVLSLYKLRKEQAVKIVDLEKKLKDSEQTMGYLRGQDTEKGAELAQAHGLLTALGIAEKTEHEESYHRKPMTVSTRIALYISTFTNNPARQS